MGFWIFSSFRHSAPLDGSVLCCVVRFTNWGALFTSCLFEKPLFVTAAFVPFRRTAETRKGGTDLHSDRIQGFSFRADASS
jgi:hypothetical protein